MNGTITRTSGQNSDTWRVKMVTSGTIVVEGTWRDGPFTRSAQITVTPRSGWTSTAPESATRQQNPFTKIDAYNQVVATRVAKSPELGIGADGVSLPYLGGHIFEDEIARVEDEGPNRHLRYVKSTRYDPSSFDYVLHGDLLDLSSDWSLAQFGNWAGVAACEYNYNKPELAGLSFISANDYREGVERHAGGPKALATKTTRLRGRALSGAMLHALFSKAESTPSPTSSQAKNRTRP